MTIYKTKTQPAYTEYYHNNVVVDGSINYPYVATRSRGENKITYEDGPKYIRMDGKMMCNWKRCHHSRGEYQTGLTATLSRFDVRRNDPTYLTHTYNWYNCPVALYSGFGLSNYSGTVPDSSIVDELMAQVYQDVAGRANEYLLSLEDFAGLFTGKSLWKGIKGVAGAFQGLAKATSDCKKLAKAFGWKNSLYNMWLSSKETVRQTLGLRLGYRFSFKTTLNDIVKAVDFGYGFKQFSDQIVKRNSSEFLRYSKRSTVSGDPTVEVYTGAALKSRLLAYSPNSSAKDYFINSYNQDELVAHVLKRGGRSAVAFCKARVRYPIDYAGMAHYYQGRFGLDKPLTTLWAIVPLSFVIDYLFNVQDALTYVDNKLNDYLVATNIGSAWTCNTAFRESVLDIPQTVTSHDIYPGGGQWLSTVEIPHIHTVYRESSEFTRTPQSASTIRAQLPSLISADDNNWVRSVGTGLELLSQTRLR